jgi:hypothetical protein
MVFTSLVLEESLGADGFGCSLGFFVVEPLCCENQALNNMLLNDTCLFGFIFRRCAGPGARRARQHRRQLKKYPTLPTDAGMAKTTTRS